LKKKFERSAERTAFPIGQKYWDPVSEIFINCMKAAVSSRPVSLFRVQLAKFAPAIG
jgi:hypothetical protein